MRLLIKLSLPLFVVLGICSKSVAAETIVPQIKVYGTAEQTVVPDELQWNISVSTRGKNVQSVADRHAEGAAAVLAYLKTVTDEKSLKTCNIQLVEDWNYRNNSRVREGFVATTNIAFTTVQFSRYLDIWTKLSSFEQVRVDDVHFAFSGREKLENEVKKEAVRNARLKAEQLAAALGVSVAEPVLIEEQGWGRSDSGLYKLKMDRAAAGGASAVAPGTEKVRSSVLVIFRLKSEE